MQKNFKITFMKIRACFFLGKPSMKNRRNIIFAGNELTFCLWWKIQDISLN